MVYTPSGAIPLPRFLSSFLGIKRNPSFSAGAFFFWSFVYTTFFTFTNIQLHLKNIVTVLSCDRVNPLQTVLHSTFRFCGSNAL